MTDKQPLGIRNHNPGNLEKGADWDGLDKQATIDSRRFCVFTEPLYGIRALSKLLLNYQRYSDLHSLRAMIYRYAPKADDNDTESYLQHVCNVAGLEPNQPFKIEDDLERFRRIVSTIITHENGMNPYEDSLIDDAIQLALQ